jgi:hypothetical protein
MYQPIESSWNEKQNAVSKANASFKRLGVSLPVVQLPGAAKHRRTRHLDQDLPGR